MLRRVVRVQEEPRDHLGLKKRCSPHGLSPQVTYRLRDKMAHAIAAQVMIVSINLPKTNRTGAYLSCFLSPVTPTWPLLVLVPGLLQRCGRGAWQTHLPHLQFQRTLLHPCQQHSLIVALIRAVGPRQVLKLAPQTRGLAIAGMRSRLQAFHLASGCL